MGTFFPGAKSDTIRKFQGSIADDAATSFQLLDSDHGWATLTLGGGGNTIIFEWDTVSTNELTLIVEGSNAANINQTTGALTGTTGTDAKFTLSIHTDDKIYIENRLGATLPYKLWIFGGSPGF